MEVKEVDAKLFCEQKLQNILDEINPQYPTSLLHAEISCCSNTCTSVEISTTTDGRAMP